MLDSFLHRSDVKAAFWLIRSQFGYPLYTKHQVITKATQIISSNCLKLVPWKCKNVAVENLVAVSTTCRTSFALRSTMSKVSSSPKTFFSVCIVFLNRTSCWENFWHTSRWLTISSKTFFVSSLTSHGIASLRVVDNFSVLEWKISDVVFVVSQKYSGYRIPSAILKKCPNFWKTNDGNTTANGSQLFLWVTPKAMTAAVIFCSKFCSVLWAVYLRLFQSNCSRLSFRV